MHRCLVNFALVFSSFCCFFGEHGNAQTTPSTSLLPMQLTVIQQSNEDYRKCREGLVGKVKGKRLSKERFEKELKTCDRKFSGIALYKKCKKEVVEKAVGDKRAMENGLELCGPYLNAGIFDPEQTFPFFIDREQLFFAGIDMNRTIPVQKLSSIPNFKCARPRSAAKDPGLGEYFLFSNDPKVFLDQAKYDEFERSVRDLSGSVQVEAGRESYMVSSIGKFYKNDAKQNLSSVDDLYFTTAPCVFSGQGGKYFSGFSLYYLVDSVEKSVTPYVGIAFFKSQKSAHDSSKASFLKDEMVRNLGEGYSIVHTSRRLFFATSQELTDVDSEGYPKNLCREPRKQDFIGLVSDLGKGDESPNYILIANLKNLCTFGDRVVQRVLKSTSQSH